MGGPLAIIAGEGDLPGVLCRTPGVQQDLCGVISIGSSAAAIPDGVVVKTLGFAEIGHLWQILSQWQAKRVLFAGGVSSRPDYGRLFPDLGTLLALPKILPALAGGDDAVLRAVASIFEGQGFQVVGLQDLAPELLAAEGGFGQKKPSSAQMQDLEEGLRVARGLGALDAGQAAVIENGRVLAVEGAEGTKAMLQRVSALRREVRISRRGGGVLVKCSKPQQDLRFDLPTIGPGTFDEALEAGLSAIGVEAENTLVLHKERLLQAVQAAGVILYGFPRRRLVRENR